MSSTTVAEFAAELKKSTATLLEQLKSAGVAKSSDADRLSEGDKQSLLTFLQASHGTTSLERKKKAEELSDQFGYTMIPPYDHAHITGTAAEASSA